MDFPQLQRFSGVSVKGNQLTARKLSGGRAVAMLVALRPFVTQWANFRFQFALQNSGQ